MFSGFINRSLSCSIAHRYVPYSYRSPPVYRQQQLFFCFAFILDYTLCAAIRQLCDVKMKVCLINLAHMDTMDVFIRHGAKSPSGPPPPRYRGFKITHRLRHIALGRTPLDE